MGHCIYKTTISISVLYQRGKPYSVTFRSFMVHNAEGNQFKASSRLQGFKTVSRSPKRKSHATKSRKVQNTCYLRTQVKTSRTITWRLRATTRLRGSTEWLAKNAGNILVVFSKHAVLLPQIKNKGNRSIAEKAPPADKDGPPAGLLGRLN